MFQVKRVLLRKWGVGTPLFAFGLLWLAVASRRGLPATVVGAAG